MEKNIDLNMCSKRNRAIERDRCCYSKSTNMENKRATPTYILARPQKTRAHFRLRYMNVLHAPTSYHLVYSKIVKNHDDNDDDFEVDVDSVERCTAAAATKYCSVLLCAMSESCAKKQGPEYTSKKNITVCNNEPCRTRCIDDECD